METTQDRLLSTDLFGVYLPTFYFFIYFTFRKKKPICSFYSFNLFLELNIFHDGQ
jgi:hypothetical protein